MPALLRRLSLVGLLAAALSATADSGYLPKVGPPAVRFERPAPPPAEPTFILPPLPFLEPRSETPTPVAVQPEAAASNSTPTPLVPKEPTAPSNADATAQEPPSPQTPAMIMDPGATHLMPADPGPLVPQMFMRYFTGQPGTNGNGVSIFAPVGFVPPVPVALPPPSSSATFQTVPAGKP